MKNGKIYFILIFLIQLSSPILACSFDTDCEPGSRCLKQGYDLYGACVGGISPGNSHDQQPIYNSINPSDSVGNTCNFDTECGLGRRCVKSNYSITGTCY